MATPDFKSGPPPTCSNVLLSYPAPHVLLVTMNRPSSLNAIPSTQHGPMSGLWDWYDNEPTLRCAVLTGAGRAFCAGADLKEWNERNSAASPAELKRLEEQEAQLPPPKKWLDAGFGGVSNRLGKKPIIAAVNGLCLGGGMEMALNCDMVVASAKAKFGLPEVKRGVVAIAGALPRIIKTVGRQRASEMALTGRMFSTAQMERWGVVNQIVEDGGDVVGEAVKMAVEVAGNSPDAVTVSREGLKLGWEGIGPDVGTRVLDQGIYGRIEGGENFKEGVRSFVEKRPPRWVDSKL